MDNLKVLAHPRFGRVRQVIVEDAPWYVGRDIGSVLGYARPEGYLVKHVKSIDCKKMPVRALDSNNTSITTIINTRGVSDMLAASNSPSAPAIRQWLLYSKDVVEDAPQQVIVIKGVRAYVDAKNVAWLDAEYIARGLGFTQTKFKDGKEFTYVRWETVNAYLEEFGFPKKVGNGSFIPENMFYRLVWKSRAERALEFQAQIADEILPSIRQHGFYALPNAEIKTEEVTTLATRIQKQMAKSCTELAVVYALLMSNLTVKIGMTKDLTDRIKQLKAETGLDTFDFASSRFMTRDDAAALEARLKKKFAADCIGGEFFDVKFTLVAAEL